jgi:HTH-type transcriptional repressor of NAD biosynthesis genes
VLVCANKNEAINGETRYNWVKDYYSNNNNVQIYLVEYDDEQLTASSVPEKEAAEKWADHLKEKFTGIDVFISSEVYGQFVADRWGIEYINFDEERETVPVSATQIRQYPFKYWQYIPEIVQPYFVKKICIVGAESTGKSVLTEHLANYYNTVFVPELARDIVDTTDNVTIDDLYAIANAHADAIIKTIPFANKLLFVDTDINITRSYASFLFGTTIAIEDWVDEANRFDLYLFLETDCPYVQDGTRVSEADREKLNTSHKNEFNKQGIVYYTIGGNWKERFNTAAEIIDKNFFGKTE